VRVDERQLGELFRDAVGEVPPASFGRDEVVTASRRATAARRNAAVGGTLLGAAVLTGGLYFGGVLDAGRSASERTSAAGQRGPEAGPGTMDSAAPHTFDAPPGAPVPFPRARPPDGAQVGCGPVDHDLATEVTGLLAEWGVEVPGPVGEVRQSCAIGARSAAVPVVGGTLYVVVVPRAGAPEPIETVTPDGKHGYSRMLTGGRELVLILLPDVPGRPIALSDAVPALAEELADRL
jgi:hypothetical protein